MSAPRIHVIPAAGCDKALVLRRGPSRFVASLLWDRKTNTLELGQWLRGRIYEHRSDLSPDGRHMIIFAGNGRRWWTTISRAPWLTALYWEPQDSTWHGGGAFTAEGRVFFNGATPPDTLPDNLKPADPHAFPHGTDGFHMGALYPAVLASRGWEIVGGEGIDTVLQRSLGGGWRLRLSFRVGGRNRSILSNAYALERDAAVLGQPVWEWAEPWADGLQVAMRGGLWSVPLSSAGAGEPVCLHDLTDMAFEPREAPYRGVRSESAR
ncbi:hypothetical protein HKCCE3408_09865 [Rhodobacterales bacterium HKCCE3408]|nr:hypothetical protein [Rhodobacterales bacterium HKCCE3408]